LRFRQRFSQRNSISSYTASICSHATQPDQPLHFVLVKLAYYAKPESDLAGGHLSGYADFSLTERESDAGVPGIAVLWRHGAQALTEPFQTIGDGHTGDVFYALVAELTGNAQTKRCTVGH
jgi:hypothetical protein